MASVQASGTVPATILENNQPGDWSATLVLSGATGALDVALTGTFAALFTATLDKRSGVVTIVPALSLDREAFSSTTAPVFTFGLSVKLPGGWQDVGQTWSVSLQGVDDAPPRTLAFTSGGTVLETDIGAEIGMIQATDPDTSTVSLTYSVIWPDSAWFELVGRTLKLRDGVDLLREGGTTREVLIEVSDGKQSAAFALAVKVLNVTSEDDLPAPPPVLVPPVVSPPVVSPPVISPPVVSPPIVSPPVVSPPIVSPPVVSPPVVSPPVISPPVVSPPVVSPPVVSPPIVSPPVVSPPVVSPPVVSPPVVSPPVVSPPVVSPPIVSPPVVSPPVVSPPVVSPPVASPPVVSPPVVSPPIVSPPVVSPPVVSPPVISPPIVSPPVVVPPIVSPPVVSPPVVSPPVVSPPVVSPPPPEPVAVPLLLGETKHGFTQVSADVVQSVHFVWNAESIATDAKNMTKVQFPGGETVWIPPVARIEFQNGHIDFSGQSQTAEVVRVYGTILGREPEAKGLTYWVEHMQKGMTVAEVSESFFDSPEFIARFGGLSHQALVISLYREALGREPEAGGLAYHLARLDAGQDRGQIIANFVQSPEAARNFEAKHPAGVWVADSYATMVGMAYDAVFDRPPDRDGLAFWTSKLASGQLGTRDLIQSIAGSAEFQARHAQESDDQYVASIYRSALEREPEPAGVAYWVQHLASHALDRIDVVMMIGLSPEQQESFARHPVGDAFLG
ncbi:DUF4214 domain-containing protein [Roseomonas aerophila]|uniref:DUF4214 domain-containing protein n=1 Tax=Teichococcus aerophilus TaxID=1224513 RepID=A0ABR7RHC0_9PROT|nr:DUF4214 domain-containing protein [Pseudoroseomonas aerophila]